MSWNLALQINKLASITRVSGSSILIYNSTGTLLATYATTGLFLGDASVGSGSAGSNKLTLPSYGSLTWAGISATPPSILTGGGANIFTRAGVAFNQNYAGTEKGQTDFALYSQVITGSVPSVVPLTYNSPIYQINTNSSTTSFRLPAVTSGVTPVGTFFIVNNNGGASATIANVSAVTLHTCAVGSTVKAILLDNTTAPDGTWEITSELPNNVNWGTANATYNGNFSLTGTHDLSVSATGGVVSNTLSSLASTKLTLNTTNGTVELQNNGAKTGDILYASASFPLQVKSTSGVSIDAGTGGNTQISSGGNSASSVINFITGTGSGTQTRAQVTDGGISLRFGNSVKFYRPDELNTWDVNVNSASQWVVAQSGGFTMYLLSGTAQTLWSTTSDERLKQDITPVETASSSLLKLRPKAYRYKSHPNAVKSVGFVAQDIQQYAPELAEFMVNESPEKAEDGTNYLGVSQSILTPYLIKAFQEQHAKITSLEAQLASLKATVDALVAQK